MSWKIRGVVFESCAAEGHCPIWLGRETSKPCTSFMVLRIDEGHIDDVAVDGASIGVESVPRADVVVRAVSKRQVAPKDVAELHQL